MYSAAGRGALCSALRSLIDERMPLLRAWDLRTECMLLVAALRDRRMLSRREAAAFVQVSAHSCFHRFFCA
jgi:hypothetical protein